MRSYDQYPIHSSLSPYDRLPVKPFPDESPSVYPPFTAYPLGICFFIKLPEAFNSVRLNNCEHSEEPKLCICIPCLVAVYKGQETFGPRAQSYRRLSFGQFPPNFLD